jgi:hypothetical protein
MAEFVNDGAGDKDAEREQQPARCLEGGPDRLTHIDSAERVEMRQAGKDQQGDEQDGGEEVPQHGGHGIDQRGADHFHSHLQRKW